MNGGKRIRPALVYATAEALGLELSNIDCVAGSIELMHCYSLIHDDLPAMDDDDLRRGQPTCHRAFDEATAILAGDAMQALAFSMLTDLSVSGPDAAIRSQLSHQLAHAVGSLGMAGGQAMDLAAVDKNISIEALEYIHRQKTGCLIRACIDMTQRCSTTLSEQQRSSLLKFSEHLGIAFQIRDDILDEISDTATLGKPQGSDRGLNKPTYVSILGIEESEQRCTDFYQQALNCLGEFSERADWLRLLAEHIVCRKH
jgi:geranylgeranyl pyrophosphate synthase